MNSPTIITATHCGNNSVLFSVHRQQTRANKTNRMHPPQPINTLLWDACSGCFMQKVDSYCVLRCNTCSDNHLLSSTRFNKLVLQVQLRKSFCNTKKNLNKYFKHYFRSTSMQKHQQFNYFWHTGRKPQKYPFHTFPTS